MKIGLDAMGSDLAPDSEVKGSLEFLKEDEESEISLIGNKEAILKSYKKLLKKMERISIIDAPQTISPDEEPTVALKEKGDSSIGVGLKLLKEGKIDGFLSAGNTGAVMAFSLFTLGKIPKIKRPALATIFPTKEGNILVLDVGGNVDAKPQYILDYGRMGKIFAEKIFKIENPRIGLLNVGTEPQKGNTLAKESYKLLSKSGLNFIGNIEGNEIFDEKADVIVTDGFTGNIMLKSAEGIAEFMLSTLQQFMKKERKYWWRKWISKPVVREFLKRLHYEEMGGAFLLGVNGTVMVSHGRSSQKAIKNALKFTLLAAKEKINEIISKEFSLY